MTAQESLLILNAVPGMSGHLLSRLRNMIGSPDQILEESESTLLELGLTPNLTANIVHFPKDKFLQAEYNDLRKIGASVITLEDTEYPPLLKEIKNAPLALYIKGRKDLLHSPSIALVGSRKATEYGQKMAESFASYFAQAGMTVISGLAYGIDTISHKSALRINGLTTAVLGCGLNHIYPKENTALFNEIANKGLLVSEFPINTAPLTYNFPRRNRIISGLSLATVVIEATEKSGALITADYALEQNREVFAVPGNADSVYSMGTNKLIKDGARMALSASEVLEEIGIEIKNQIIQTDSQEKPYIKLSEEEYKIYEMLNESPQHIDAILSNLKEDIGSLLGRMIDLELKGLVKQLPGQYYTRRS